MTQSGAYRISAVVVGAACALLALVFWLGAVVFGLAGLAALTNSQTPDLLRVVAVFMLPFAILLMLVMTWFVVYYIKWCINPRRQFPAACILISLLCGVSLAVYFSPWLAALCGLYLVFGVLAALYAVRAGVPEHTCVVEDSL